MLEPDTGQQRENLADALKQLRNAAGLSGERLAVRVAMSQSKISRIESGKALPTVADVERIMTALDVPSHASEELLALTRSANVEYTSLRSSGRLGIWRSQDEIASLTKSASVIRQFLPAIPTGLIQTRDYARAVLTPAVEGRPARDVGRAVRARLDAQETLNDKSRRFHFLLTEQSVRARTATDAVMVGQLRHMIDVSERPNVTLSVLPSRALIESAPLNVFIIYDDRLVTTEIFAGRMVFRDHRDITYHLNVFEHFHQRALTGEHAREFLASVADEFR